MNEAWPRRAGRKALHVLLRPFGVLVIALWLSSFFWPRRVPDLRRLIRDGDFPQVQSGAAVWIDKHFELIDENTPWLERVGRWVSDRCETSLESNVFSIPRDAAKVRCTRDVTVVYGTDGNLRHRLGELRTALSLAGWTISDHTLEFGESLGESIMSPFQRSAVYGPNPPPSLGAMPAYALDMGVGWASQGQPPEILTTRGNIPCGRSLIATAVYQPVEVGVTGVDQLASEALERREHAIAIRIGLTYYSNPNVNAEPQRLRKRLLPVPPWAQAR